MFERTVSPDDLTRLKEAREAADRRYNDALTALDAAVPAVPTLPGPPPAPDDHQVPGLNADWRLMGEAEPSFGRGLKGRLAGFVWRLVAPYLQRQQAFNSRVVDHVNRSVRDAHEARRSLVGLGEVVRADAAALTHLATRLILFLQQVTAYVDTKDHEFAGLARRLAEDNGELLDILDHRTVGLSGAISGVADELLKRWESMVAREHRYEARAASLTAAHGETQATLATLQQATQTVRRELTRALERLAAVEATAASSAARAEGAPTAPATTGHPAGFSTAGAASALQQAAASPVDSYKYVGFEDRFRGAREEIRDRLTGYLPLFEGASDVLDVGCGRGEFLDLLRQHGISARGLDLNHEMVEQCRGRGLRVDEGDAVGFLQSLPDGALGGLMAAQVVEHLQPDYLLALLDVAYHKLRPGSRIVLETINPACWFAFFQSYIRDITHVRPLHPDTLAYFLGASGFQGVTVRYSAPYPEHEKLRRVGGDDPLSQAFDANVDRLNGLLFTYLDYAAVGERR